MFHLGNKYVGIHVSICVLFTIRSYVPLLLSGANDYFHYIREWGDCTANTFEILGLKTT